ncbi:MAG TPA: hypothetical protein DEO85_15980 [Maritimibacter sp.]|nr:hypothetical protein [Maritimibacter sp.]
MKRLLAAALISTLPLTAMAFDTADKAAVEATVSEFDTAYSTGDFGTVLDYLPPKLIDYMATQMGSESQAELKATMAKQMAAFMSDIKIDAFDMNTNRMKTGEAGGRSYAFIPTTTKITAEGKTRTLRNQTLALEDGGRWYVVRIEADQQYNLVKEVYPEFGSVRLP